MDDHFIKLHIKPGFENAKVAILLAETMWEYFPIKEEHIVAGLKEARHPGRLEYHGKYLFDGAHNIGGANALADFIKEFETRPITLIFGAMNDKSAADILAIVAPVAERIVVTEPDNPRALLYDELLAALPPEITKERAFATDNVASAVDIAETVTPDDGIILVTGSLYLVGEVKRLNSSRSLQAPTSSLELTANG